MFNFWQYFHDGGVTQITGSIPGDLEIFVEITYLREMFLVGGTNFIVYLQNCTQIKYRPFQGAATSEMTEITAAKPQILYANFTKTGIEIECDKGILQLDYESASITLDSGQIVSNEELHFVSNRYWDSFAKDHHVN